MKKGDTTVTNNFPIGKTEEKKRMLCNTSKRDRSDSFHTVEGNKNWCNLLLSIKVFSIHNPTCRSQFFDPVIPLLVIHPKKTLKNAKILLLSNHFKYGKTGENLNV